MLTKGWNLMTFCKGILYLIKKSISGTSLVVQWLRIRLLMQRTWIWSLIRELRSHVLQDNWSHMLQLLSPCATTREKPEHQSQRGPCAAAKIWCGQISKKCTSEGLRRRLSWQRTRGASSIRGSGRSAGGGHGNPLQYSCWESPMDRGGCVCVYVCVCVYIYIYIYVYKYMWN